MKTVKTKKATTKMFIRLAKLMEPPKDLTVSEWADAYRQLSSEASSEPGKWDTSRAPYQKRIMDCVSDGSVTDVVVMSSAQIGKSEIILNILGYYVDYDPSPILLLQPTLQMAEAFSTDRLAPMVRDTKCLSDKIGDPKSKSSGNTVLHKTFPGGHVTLAGANSPASLASRPIRILLCDEVDRYPESAGTEGDPLMLAAKRTTTFWNKKKIYVSTPTIKNVSRIEREYETSSMEEWNIKCPSCGELQPYEWARINFEDATMTCKNCGALHREYEWKSQDGEWIAKFPERKKIGFHVNELASPWKRWEEIIEDFLYAKKSTETLKVWVNTALGESWEEFGDGADDQLLFERREKYDCEIPDEVLVLTAGVDVQDDRFEVEVVGWTDEDESFGIQYKVIFGDLHKTDVWNELDEFLKSEFSYADGKKIRISCVCIDSGGHFTQNVYKFTKPREIRRIFSIKGKGGEGIPFISKVSRNNRENAALFTVGVDAGKETIISSLKLDVPGAGYCHFPYEHEKGYTVDYFRGLTSESLVIKMVNGVPKAKWTKKNGVRNEPLDCRNYAMAALKILNPNYAALRQRRDRSELNTITKTRKIQNKGLEL